MSQKTQVLAHLKTGNSITQEQAIALFRCFRLAVVIERLRDDGHRILTERVGDTGYGRYSLGTQNDTKRVDV